MSSIGSFGTTPNPSLPLGAPSPFGTKEYKLENFQPNDGSNKNGGEHYFYPVSVGTSGSSQTKTRGANLFFQKVQSLVQQTTVDAQKSGLTGKDLISKVESTLAAEFQNAPKQAQASLKLAISKAFDNPRSQFNVAAFKQAIFANAPHHSAPPTKAADSDGDKDSSASTSKSVDLSA